MIRCEDDSIYTGITTDLNRRIHEHISKNEKCAKYTKNHTVFRLEAAWISENRKTASRLEFYIKKLAKSDKEVLINNPTNLGIVFKEKLDDSIYVSVDKQEFNF